MLFERVVFIGCLSQEVLLRKGQTNLVLLDLNELALHLAISESVNLYWMTSLGLTEHNQKCYNTHIKIHSSVIS